MSTEPKPPGKQAALRGMQATLRQLLRKPKTRAELIAAVAGPGVSGHFVYGWLTEQLRTGVVTELKSSKPATFQLASAVIAERPPAGLYPEWLEPRTLPRSSRRRAYFDGKAVATQRKRAKKP